MESMTRDLELKSGFSILKNGRESASLGTGLLKFRAPLIKKVSHLEYSTKGRSWIADINVRRKKFTLPADSISWERIYKIIIELRLRLAVRHDAEIPVPVAPSIPLHSCIVRHPLEPAGVARFYHVSFVRGLGRARGSLQTVHMC